MDLNFTEENNAIEAGGLASDHVPDEFLGDPVLIQGTATGIPTEAVPYLTIMTQAFIADVIQHYIDAGSERDVIMEDEELYLVLNRVFRDWSPDWEADKPYTMEITR